MTDKKKPNLTWDKENETLEQYMARVKEYMNSIKSTELTLDQESKLRAVATKIVNEIRGADLTPSDKAILKEIDPGYKKKKK